MSKERIKIAPEMFDIMPEEYQDLVYERATMVMNTAGGRISGPRRN